MGSGRPGLEPGPLFKTGSLPCHRKLFIRSRIPVSLRPGLRRTVLFRNPFPITCLSTLRPFPVASSWWGY